MGFNVFSRQQWKLIQNGMTPDQARRLAYKQQSQQGNLLPGSFQLSDRGKQVSELTPGQRAIMRRARSTGKSPAEYEYRNGKVYLKSRRKKIGL